ncbi:MAG: hypothetical protein RIR52_263 [Acidobacteriota bacterium]|jgi:glycine oxidase
MRDNDLLVIGGGLIGCSVAWEAAKRGLRVTVLERGEVGSGATYAAGGMLAPLSEADGESPFLQLARRSAELYPGFVADLRAAVGIDVEYRTEGTLYLSLSDSDDLELESRYRWQHESGLKVERLTSTELLRLEPALTPETRWALLFPDDRQVNNRRLITAVHEAALASGVVFRTNTAVERLLIDGSDGQSTDGLSIRGVRLDSGSLEANRVVIAAGCWSCRITDAPATGVKPIRGQMIAVRNTSPPVRHVVYSHRGYLIPRLDGRLIAGSTTEEVGFDCRNTAGGIASVLTHAAEMMPAFMNQPIVETWAGLRPRATDHLPILGADPLIRGLIHATGHYRNGILLAPVTARIVGDLLTGVETGIDLIPFSPSRNLPRHHPV